MADQIPNAPHLLAGHGAEREERMVEGATLCSVLRPHKMTDAQSTLYSTEVKWLTPKEIADWSLY